MTDKTNSEGALAAQQVPAEATWGAAKALIQRHDSIEDALRIFGDDPTDDNGTGVVIAVLEAMQTAAPQAPAVPQIQPLTADDIESLALDESLLLLCDDIEDLTEIVRAVEQMHSIRAAGVKEPT